GGVPGPRPGEAEHPGEHADVEGAAIIRGARARLRLGADGSGAAGRRTQRSASIRRTVNPEQRSRFDHASAILFDLDGVLTPTAELHMHAWAELFEAVLTEHGDDRPYT